MIHVAAETKITAEEHIPDEGELHKCKRPGGTLLE